MPQVLDVGIRPDDRIGNYRVEAALGPTGSGFLLQAHHLVLPRRAILKVVRQAFAAAKPFVVQTLREACILEAIAHPGVPVVYESGMLRDRRPWFAFELIRGMTLEEHLAAGPLEIPDVAALLRDLVDVLEHAHRRGVIHRGLRPDRVMITLERRYPLCIPDWSEAMAHDATTRLPQAWDGAGHYIAPELAHQLAHGTQEHVDDRVDMFALGAIAYRALTGRLPFDGQPEPARYVPVSQLRADAPPELAVLVDSLLAFDRFDRPSAFELRTDIDWLLGTVPALQRRAAVEVAAPAPSPADRINALHSDVVVEAVRQRRPRWTPEIGYPESTDVEVVAVEERGRVGTT
jgi:eukaryotic-like serine/threonine-protein kinase